MDGGGQESASSELLYRPFVQSDSSGFENLVKEAELQLRNDVVGQCETIHDMDDSQLVGAPVVVAVAGAGGGGDELALQRVDEVMKVETELLKVGENSGVAVKRKRGRPPRALPKPPPPPPKKKKDEEDVCFICFDGGNLVLCDRRGCPKAYHPACIKRDEAFFRSRAKWNCGWHICSNCEKASHYMCYTCTYSLCKGCIKEADILCVRGNKGFCTTCMRTVLLVENSEQGNKDMVQVDFDDKSSWEYLFKVYWIYLKTKLSLTLDELTKAKNPGKAASFMARKGEALDQTYEDKGSSSDSSYADLDGNTSKRQKTKKQPKFHNKEGSVVAEKAGVESAMSLSKGSEWATTELLEFVAHMKNGDTSVLSQFDVQALLLEYIKINNLRDPRRKSQIICDSRLGNMFGKARVGHFEMLKLLESHFLIREDSHVENIIRGGFVNAVASQVEVNGNDANQLMMGKDRKRKTRKKGDNKGPQTNLDEYAAIDAHNINLIFLRRNLMENLSKVTEKFYDKVVGSVVRIRISSNDQKQDMYRLVQVVGTSKMDVPSKTDKSTADVKLEILNLDKKEVIPIDEISNQEFSEDECRRLRQSIKCGITKRFTVGEIQEKAVALQEVRVNDWLEVEILRLNHLRDRASEKGHRKELRECVEKLQLLNTPEERERRLLDIPEVHADPKMNPSYESEEDAGESDDKKQGDDVGPRCSGFSKRGRGQVSPQRVVDISKYNESRTRNAYGPNSWEKPRNMVDPTGSAIGACNDQAVLGSESISGVTSETSIVPPTDTTPSSDDTEALKIWHYRDPSGRIQGPFCMAQLRKWDEYFPTNQRIWRINEQEDDSMLLTDAFNGQYHKQLSVPYNCHDVSAHSNGNVEFVRSTCSSSWSTPADVVNSKEEQAASFSQGQESLKGNNTWSNQPQMYSSLTSASFSGTPYGALPHQEREDDRDERLCSGQNHGNWNSLATTVLPNNSGQSNEKCNDSGGHSGQSSIQDLRPPLVNCSSNSLNFDSGVVSVAKSTETSECNHGDDFPNLPSPTPKSSKVDCKGQADENKQSVSLNAPLHDSENKQSVSLNAPLHDSENKQSVSSNVPLHDSENKQSVSSNIPLQDSGPSWSTASSLVGSRAQLSEVAGEWGGYSPTPDKPSVEKWDSNLVPEKHTELASDVDATPTSKGDELAHSSPSHPTSNTSSWPAIITGPNEFPLAEESVSDLLAEVDAIESLSELPSPTSKMSIEVLAQLSKNDRFSSVEGLSPTPDPGKSDAFSSTSDVQMPPAQSNITDEPKGVSQADVIDPPKRSSRHSSTSPEVEGEGKLSDVSVNQFEPGSDTRPLAPPSTESWDIPATDVAWRAGSETTDTSWGPAPGNANMGWVGPAQMNTNMPWGSDPVAAPGNANMNWGISAGNIGLGVSQPKYSGESFSGPRERERGFPSVVSGFGRDRSHWNRQSSFGGGGGGGGGGFSRPPPKQRLCKFYGSGHCKKGALCDYRHQ